MTCVITSVNLDTHDYIGSATEPDRKCATQSNVLQQREPVYALSCFHLFHVICLRPWFYEKPRPTCPICTTVKRPHGVVNDTLSVSKESNWQKSTLLVEYLSEIYVVYLCSNLLHVHHVYMINNLFKSNSCFECIVVIDFKERFHDD